MMNKRRQSDQQGLSCKEVVTNNRRNTINGVPVQEAAAPAIESFTPSKHHKLHIGAATSAYYFSGTPKSSKKPKDLTGDISIGFGDTSMISLGGTSSSSEESDLLNQSVLSDTTELTASNFILAAASRQMLLESKMPDFKKSVALQDQENQGTNSKQTPKQKTPSGGTREPLSPLYPSPEPTPKNEQIARLRELTNSLRKNRLNKDEVPAVSRRDSIHSTSGTAVPPLSPAPERTTPAHSQSGLNKSVSSSDSTATEDSSRTTDVSATSLDELFAGLLEEKDDAKVTNTSIDSPLLNPTSVEEDASMGFTSPEGNDNETMPIASLVSAFNIAPNSPSRLKPSRLSGSPARTHLTEETRTDMIEEEEHFSSPSTIAEKDAPFRLAPHNHHTRLTPTKIAPSPRRLVNPASSTSPARNTRSKSPQKLAIEEIIALASKTSKSRMSDISIMSAIDPKKRRNSDITNTTASAPDLHGLFSNESPATNSSFQRVAPKSILNSSKKHKTTRDSLTSKKSVAFGSPEAAEYRIGSPSVNLTPMPHNQAKAMYAIPSDSSSESPGIFNEEPSMSSNGGEDHTVEMDVDLSALLNQVEEQDMDTTEGSDSENDDAEDNMKSKNQGAAQELATSITDEDQTIELESNIQGLLVNTFNSNNSSDTPSNNSNDSCSADSVAMDDSVSIDQASMPFSKHESDTSTAQNLSCSPEVRQHMDAISPMSEATSMITEEDENTVELEGDLAALLSAASQGGTDGDTSDELRSIKLTDKFPKMQSSLVPRTERMSFGEPLDISPSNEDSTIEFETTIDSVVDAVRNSTKRENFTGTIELETNIQSLLVAVESPIELPVKSNDEEEIDTIELETNMDSLLYAADVIGNHPKTFDLDSVVSKGEIFHFDLSDTPRTSGDPRRRSSSASSQRFSLVPSSRVSLSKDGLVLGSQDEPFVLDVPKNPTNESNLTADDDEEDTLELTSALIDSLTGLQSLVMNHEIDTVAEAKSISDITKNQFITEALEGFVAAVCTEVEGKAEISSDSDTCFRALVEEMPDELLQLQKSLREDDGKELIRDLANSVQIFVENEWNSWETMVAEALVGQVDQIPEELEDDEDRIRKCFTLMEDTQEALSLMAGRAAQQARRRSMNRRMTAASLMDNQIDQLEQELAHARQGLETVNLHLEATNDAAAREVELESVNNQLAFCQKDATSCQGRFVSLKGLSSATPLEVGDSKLSIAFVGTNPKLCFTVAFDLQEHGPVACNAVVNPAHFKLRRGRIMQYTPTTVGFIKARVSTMVESVSKKKLSSMSEIGILLQRLEWTKGRIELTANELATLQRRYSAGISMDQDGGSKSDFLIQVVFNGKEDKLFATFELSASYPFGPLQVSLDTETGKFDVDLLKKYLISNAKPGFGYMLRACDVMSAYIR